MKGSGPVTATKKNDNIGAALGPSDSKEDTTYALSYTEGAHIQDRDSEGITSTNPGNAVAGDPTPAISHDTQAAGEEATTTAAGPSTPTDGRGSHSAGLLLGGDAGVSSCDSENMSEEDPIMAAVPSKSIQWQRPVPSGISATGTTTSTGAWAKPLVTKPTDISPTIEKRSWSPLLLGGVMLDSHVNKPLSEAGITQQHPLPIHQQGAAPSAGIDTDQPFLQQGSRSMTVGTDARHGENPEPFDHNTAPPHTTNDTGPIPEKPAPAVNMDLSQLPRNIFSSIERFLNDDFPISSNQGLWLRGVQCGIGHGLATLKRVILEEIEHKGCMFGRPYPLDPGQTRSEQRRAIEAHIFFDRLVAKLAGDTFMATQSKDTGLRRRHGRNGRPLAAPFPQAPIAYGSPTRHMNPGSTTTPLFPPRFATSPMSADGLAAQGDLSYPLDNPGFSPPAVGPWMNPSPNVTGTQNHGIGDKMQAEGAAFPEFAAVPEVLPPKSTVWRSGEFPRASPQLTTTEDGQAVISMSRRQE